MSYSSALTYYGMARNLIFTYPYLSQKRAHQYQLGNDCFQPCMPSKELKDAYHFGVTTQILWNTPIQVVCKERLLVDLLDRLSLSGGWEEIADAFQYENEYPFVFFSASVSPESYAVSCDDFVGVYNLMSNPKGVMADKLPSRSSIFDENYCCAFQLDVELLTNEEKSVYFVLANAKDDQTAVYADVDVQLVKFYRQMFPIANID